MSGFLRRLAAGVLNSQRAIHPSLGTIWSATNRSVPEMPGQLGIEPNSAEEIESSSKIVAPLSSSRKDAPTSPAVERERNLPNQVVVFEPLLAHSQKNSAASSQLAGQTKSAAQTNEVSGQIETIAPLPLDTTPEEAASRQQPPHRESPRLLPPAPHIPAPAGAASSLLPPAGTIAKQAQTPAHEPDTIEIHIGRIEVLAAPARPVQPAPKPSRKPLDLGEYLRRERRPR